MFRHVLLCLFMLSKAELQNHTYTRHLCLLSLFSVSSSIKKILACDCNAAARSLQSCPTLCDPIDSSPPGSPIPGFSRQEHWSGLPFPSPIHESEKWKWSRSVVSNSSRTHGLQPTRLLCTWGFPGKSTGVGCHRLLRYTYILVYNRSIKYNLNSWKTLSLQY